MRISDWSSDVCSSDLDNPHAGLYAFVTTRLGDLGLFVAAMATFSVSGGFAYSGLAELDGPMLSIAAFGILLSAAAKSGQVPFSPWLFRAMAGPTSVSALLTHSDERRVGKECVRTCRSRWSPIH